MSLRIQHALGHVHPRYMRTYTKMRKGTCHTTPGHDVTRRATPCRAAPRRALPGRAGVTRQIRIYPGASGFRRLDVTSRTPLAHRVEAQRSAHPLAAPAADVPPAKTVASSAFESQGPAAPRRTASRRLDGRSPAKANRTTGVGPLEVYPTCLHRDGAA